MDVTTHDEMKTAVIAFAVRAGHTDAMAHRLLRRVCHLGVLGQRDRWGLVLSGLMREEAEGDTLGEWLYQRFGRAGRPAWADLDESDRSHWRHEAAAVRRAVARGGFKDPR